MKTFMPRPHVYAFCLHLKIHYLLCHKKLARDQPTLLVVTTSFSWLPFAFSGYVVSANPLNISRT